LNADDDFDASRLEESRVVRRVEREFLSSWGKEYSEGFEKQKDQCDEEDLRDGNNKHGWV
jgi:hypothetical protein